MGTLRSYYSIQNSFNFRLKIFLLSTGASNCPHFARIELLADQLHHCLPSFYLHKIVKQPHEWNEWLTSECSKNGWKHEKSPLVWRELVDRGGKGVLIGGANEFQVISSDCSTDVLLLSNCLIAFCRSMSIAITM